MNFDRIGKKIKGFVKVLFYLQVIVYGVLALFLAISMAPIGILIGLLVFIVGTLIAWISSWMLYGYGELIDKTTDIAEFLEGDDKSREGRLRRLLSLNLISEEEYQQALSKE